MRCARSNGFPVVMLHATPDNDDGCEFSRFFGDCSDIPTHGTPEPWEPFIAAPSSDAALTLPLVSRAAPDLQLRARATGRDDAASVDLRRAVQCARTRVVHRPLPTGQ